MAGPGPRNSLTDVPGIKVGCVSDGKMRSGVTVILPDAPVVAAVDCRGGAPGTIETESLDPTCLVNAVDALILSGGSAFGLDASSGVRHWLAANGRGFPVGDVQVPIVPGAIIFDLLNGGEKPWAKGQAPNPYGLMAAQACQQAAAEVPLGSYGAGTGATAGRLKGGQGTASWVDDDGIVAAALIIANPAGEVTHPGTNRLYGYLFGLDEDGIPAELETEIPVRQPGDYQLPELEVGRNTTIGVVATNAKLTKAQAERIAIMAHDGLARAISPVHTPVDGDTLFVLSTGEKDLHGLEPRALAALGAMAADCVTRAVARGVASALAQE